VQRSGLAWGLDKTLYPQDSTHIPAVPQAGLGPQLPAAGAEPAAGRGEEALLSEPATSLASSDGEASELESLRDFVQASSVLLP